MSAKKETKVTKTTKTVKTQAPAKAVKATKPAVTKSTKPAVKATPAPAAPTTPPEVVTSLAISAITADHANNVRYFKEDPQQMQGLVESIKADGVIEPLLVTTAEGKGGEKGGGKGEGFILVAGYRRLTAAKAAGLKSVPVVVREGMSDQDRLKLALQENIQRRNLSPMEFALNIKRVRGEFAWEGEGSTAKVARFLSVSPATITQYEKLLQLPAAVQRKVHERTIGSQAGQDVAAIVEEFGEDVGEKVLERAQEIEKKRRGKKGKGAKSTKAPKPRKAEVEEEDNDNAGDDDDAMDTGDVGAAGDAGDEDTAESDSDTPPPVITQAAVRKAAREFGIGTDKARKLGDWTEFLEGLAMDDDTPRLKEYAEKSLEWQRGKLEDEEYLAYLMGVFVD